MHTGTRRLFDEDSHRCQFEAKVVGILPGGALPGGASSAAGENDAAPAGQAGSLHPDTGGMPMAAPGSGPWVALDATAFFPAEGGQRADRGSLSGIAVTSLLTDQEGVIWHRLEREPDWGIGRTIEGSVDPSARRDHRQQHSGQHILSRVFSERLHAATRSFHMGEETSTIDIACADLEPKEALAVENRANAIVMDDLPVTIAERQRSGERPLRTVVIEGIESQHCCGTHVKRTGEVGSIKILRWEKSKGLVRVHFVCGGRALDLFQRLLEAADRAARPFSVGWFDLPRAVEGLVEGRRVAEHSARQWQKRWAGLEAARLAGDGARSVDGTLHVTAWIDGADSEILLATAKRILLAGRATLVLAGPGEPGKRPWIAARTDDLAPTAVFDARAVLASILDRLGGRGGGSRLLAQGACPATEEECKEALREIAAARS